LGAGKLRESEYEDDFQDPIYAEEVDLRDIEGRDPARARFIRGYLKATI
jgi:hypothetical protein